MQQKFGVDTVLQHGGGGVFDVTVNGKLVFSKHKEGRFPEPDEVLAQIATLPASS
ncbi:MAG: Rdx family protein [Polyangiaceae bacterium]|nr:Rdx family protein [Polyangiaceae bacterium]